MKVDQGLRRDLEISKILLAAKRRNGFRIRFTIGQIDLVPTKCDWDGLVAQRGDQFVLFVLNRLRKDHSIAGKIHRRILRHSPYHMERFLSARGLVRSNMMIAACTSSSTEAHSPRETHNERYNKPRFYDD